MECPYCGSLLDYDDSFGRFMGFGDGKVFGYIYRCPKGREESEECESSCFHVAGSFYVYKNDESRLLEGYPC